MDSRKRQSNSKRESLPPKTPKKSNGPKLRHRGRMTFICFLVHKNSEDSMISSVSSNDVDMIDDDLATSPSSSSSENDVNSSPEPIDPEEHVLRDDSSSSSEPAQNLMDVLNAMVDQDYNESSSDASIESSSSEEEEISDEDEEIEDEQVQPGDAIPVNLVDLLEQAVAEDSENSSSYVEEEQILRKTLMISNQFLNSYFNGLNHQVILKVNDNYSSFDLSRQWNHIYLSLYLLTSKHVIALFRLSKIRRIYINNYASVQDTDVREALQNWIQICRFLKESTTLNEISIETEFTTRAPKYRMFFDVLPDKLTFVEAKVSVAYMLLRRKNIMRYVSLFNCWKCTPIYAPLFKIKTTILDIRKCESILLNHLSTCGRFAPNPIIQEVQMNVVLMSPTNSFNESKWNELNKALTCLKMVNPNIVLNLKTTVFGGKKVQTTEDGINDVKRLIKNVRRLIDMIKQTGFGIDIVEVRDCVSSSRKCSPDLLKRIAIANGLGSLKSEKIDDKIVYKNVDIKFKMCCELW